jgi:OmpA family
VSGELFVLEYRTALAKAGWVISNESKGADASVLAHYSQHGRNLWANLRWNNDNYQIQVAEAGAKNLGKTLSANCHVALSGLLFDFNETAREVPLKDGSSPLTISPSEINGDLGETGTFAATTTTTVPGAFSWQMVKEQEIDDLTAYILVASSCAGQTTCTAKLVNHHPGFVSVQVAFHPASSTQIMQAESVPVLRQALASLKKDRSLRVEVQGHTDNVGTDAYNQMLSDSRAAAVVAWLIQHGTAAARLTSKVHNPCPISEKPDILARAKRAPRRTGPDLTSRTRL